MLPRPLPRISAVILAGGLSTRMGRDKSKLRLGRLTLTGILRRTCQEAGLTVRVVRRDAVPRCGPLGGLVTGLTRTRSDALVFLSCDMPFVSARLIRRLVREARRSQHQQSVFFADGAGVGFPCLLWKANLPQVEQQIRRSSLSLQALARALLTVQLRPTGKEQAQRLNVNTPDEWEAVRLRWIRKRRGIDRCQPHRM